MQRKPTIYILDDEADVLEVIADLVEPLRAKVRTFTRTDNFLSGFRDDGPGCLVLDVRMQGMSGMELQARLTQAGCRIPIIIITGYADVRMAVEAMKAGAAKFFEKPFRPQELFEEIQKSLRADIEAWKHRSETRNVEQKLAILKTREREVLDRIREGKSNKEIAEELHLSIRGVEARRAKAMKTLRVDTKSKLMKLLGDSPSRKSSKPAF